jgi:thiol-disulfide isomerase/thioredoxin
MRVNVEEKSLFDPEHIRFSTLLFFSPSNSLSGRRFMCRGEAINNHGTAIEIFNGKEDYMLHDDDSTITKREKTWQEVSKAFENNVFSKWLITTEEKRGITANNIIRDTLIEGIHLQYFKTKQDSLTFNMGGGHIQRNADGTPALVSKEHFFYIEPTQHTLKRQEDYLYMSNDTQITISDLQYVKELKSDAAFQKVMEDTLKKYLAIFKFNTPELFSAGTVQNASFKPDTFIGKPFPPLALGGLFGRSTTVADLPHKYVLLEYTYNSCLPCHNAIPILQRIQATYAENDLAVIGVNPNDKMEDIQFAMKKDSIDYPIYTIKKSDLLKIGVVGFPTFILLDNNRIIRFYSIGCGMNLYATLSKSINDMVNGK